MESAAVIVLEVSRSSCREERGRAGFERTSYICMHRLLVHWAVCSLQLSELLQV